MSRLFCWFTCLCLGHSWSSLTIRDHIAVTLRRCACCGRKDYAGEGLK